MSPRRALVAFLALVSCVASPAQQISGSLTIHLDRPGHAIPRKFFGMMTEEINHAYDGGLYAELIRNRAFTDDRVRPVHWSPVGSDGASILALDSGHPVPGTVLKVALRVDASRAAKGKPVGVANAGYWGIPVKPNTTYRASFYARSDGASGPVRVAIVSEKGGRILASASVRGLTAAWKQYSVRLRTEDVTASSANRLEVTTETPGSFELALVSLFPPTFKNRPNGLRPDLMRLMAQLKPKFLRLPGGNYLEGNTLAERFDWKKTIGPISQRPGHPCPWGYPSTDGMGLLEFLQWCEDLQMEPLLGVFAGYALRGEHIPAGPGLAPYVQDALDEIEYITGPVTSKWGARRAKDGHPKPFPLHYVEIGNEDWFDRSGSYDGRFAQFYDAFRKRYPRLRIIATMPVRSRVPDLIDDHYYRSADEMAIDSDHYSKMSRKGPKIFVGEWATTEGAPTPTLRAAIGDAAWLTGLERDSDLVELEAYAPLLVNVNPGAWQWRTNLIGYDASTAFGSPAYWTQVLFGRNTGDTTVPYSLSCRTPQTAPVAFHGRAGVGTYRTNAEYRDFRVTSNGTVLFQDDLSRDTGAWKLGPGEWKFENGSLVQTSDARGSRALAGDEAWTDYTVEVRGRKLSGREGFFVLFHASDGQFWQWNVGGWNNTREAVQVIRPDGSNSEVGQSKPIHIDENRWYDLKLEVGKGVVRGYLDGKKIMEVSEKIPAPEPIYASVSRIRSTGEVIVKLVNTTAAEARITLDLPNSYSRLAKGWVLTGAPLDQNSIEQPNKITPKSVKIRAVGGRFVPRLPANSLTVLRLRKR